MRLEVLGKAGLVHAESTLGGQLDGHLDGEAVGVVEVEGGQPVQLRAAVELGGGLLKLAQALLEGALKALLLQGELLQHDLFVAQQLGVDRRELIDDDLGNGGQAVFG